MTDAQEDVPASAVANERALRLIDYLQELAKLRTKAVRDVGEYEHVVWFHALPHEQGCATQAWGPTDDLPADIWLKVVQHREPAVPAVPEVCAEWVKPETLNQSSGEPELRSQIVVRDEPAGSDEDEEAAEVEAAPEPRLLELADHPEVQAAWHSYVAGPWREWAKVHRRWQSVHNFYAKLFTIYQAQQRLGEEYELVLGIGLLRWRTPAGQAVQRHLITGRAELHFDARSGTFRLGPATEGANLQLEWDMLEVQERPQRAELDKAAEALQSLEDDPWDRGTRDPLLRICAHGIDNRGQYDAERLKPPDEASTTPHVACAPALILRKRSTRGLLQRLEEIRKQISEGHGLPTAFQQLCEAEPSEQDEEHERRVTVPDGTIYFPLEANREQQRIVEWLQSSSGVLVQGPPGTGKSHTIANLICHLLATGQRVLVTAQGPRALQVLQDKLPEALRPLCISFLGSGLEEQRALERSVDGILSRIDRYHPERDERRLARLETELAELRAKRREHLHRLRTLREAETHAQVIASGHYRGTAANIARRLHNEREELAWLPDAVPHDEPAPLANDEFRELLQQLREWTPEREAEIQQKRLDPATDLPAAEQLSEWIAAEQQAATQLRASGGDPSDGTAVTDPSSDALGTFFAAVGAYRDELSDLASRPTDWVRQAVSEVVYGNTRPWEELGRLSHDALEGLDEAARWADDQTLRAPEGIDRDRLRNDADRLRAHLEGGGGLGWWIFRPKVVKSCRYLWDQVTLSGEACDNVDALKRLLSYINAERRIEALWRLWEGKVERHPGAFALQVASIAAHDATLRRILDLRAQLGPARSALNELGALTQPEWHDLGSIDQCLAEGRLLAARQTYAKAQEQLQQVERALAQLADQADHHETTSAILAAIRDRNLAEFRSQLEALKALNARESQFQAMRAQFDSLGAQLPNLAAELRDAAHAEHWDVRAGRFEQAWYWGAAWSWLHDYLGQADEASLNAHIQQLDVRFRKTLNEIAELRGWRFCFDRMDQGRRQHLMGWRQAIRKVGKGTGKYAIKHRRDAQAHLEACRDAVPAWVMPLYRVYETIKAEPGAFDVIIVDEASQCGPESLPLMYLGRQILVVGDDQQISPEAVGLNRDAVHSLARQYLYDFDHADSFDLESSLFAHGDRRFGGRIPLREHFRCVPETIRYSNDLCYESAPLIPLRQYPPTRLEPLQKRHIPEGERTGQGQNVVNEAEADAIVEQIVQCCQQVPYAGRTMGVITLQGKAQALKIEQMLLDRLGAEEMQDRKLICGDAYSFQGDERDVVFLSMVAAPNVHNGVLSRAADRRRFNVATSRARDQMWLFHSVALEDLSPHCLRYSLLNYFLSPTGHLTQALGEDAEQLRQQAHEANRAIVDAPEPFDSWFEVDVALQIASRGYRVVPQFPIAGKKIDLMIEGSRSRLAVECDGDNWHGAEEYEQDMTRQRMLERCGWRFWRVRESTYYADREAALEPLWRLLQELHIRPLGAAGDQAHDPKEGAGDALVDGDRDEAAEVAEAVDDGSDESGPDHGHGGEPAQRLAASPVGEDNAAGGDFELSTEPAQASRSLFDAPDLEGDATQLSDGVAAPSDREADRADPPSEPPSEEQAIAAEIAGVEPSVWLRLWEWAEERDVLRSWERSLVRDLGKQVQAGRQPSIEQARLARRILSEARQLGFMAPTGAGSAPEAPSDTDARTGQQEAAARPRAQYVDPRQATPAHLLPGLAEIVRTEGPLPCHYAYRLYVQRAGFRRVTQPVQKILNRTIAQAVREGAFQEEDEHGVAGQMYKIIRLAGTPRVRVRPRGERELADIPPSEIAAVMHELTHRGGTVIGRLNQETTYRKVLNHYGFARLGKNARQLLDTAWAHFCRMSES